MKENIFLFPTGSKPIKYFSKWCFSPVDDVLVILAYDLWKTVFIKSHIFLEPWSVLGSEDAGVNRWVMADALWNVHSRGNKQKPHSPRA